MKEIDRRGLEKMAVISTRVVKDKKINQENYIHSKNILSNKDFLKDDKLRFFIVLGVYGGLTT